MTDPKAPSRSRARQLVFAVAAASILGCQDTTPPELPAGGGAQVTVRYVCGRNFELGDGNPAAVTVRFEVAGSGESGELLLSARGTELACRR